MEIIKEFDRVLLKDGRKGDVMEVFGDQDQFWIDYEITPGDWASLTVSRADIARVLPKVLPAIEQEKRAI